MISRLSGGLTLSRKYIVISLVAAISLMAGCGSQGSGSDASGPPYLQGDAPPSIPPPSSKFPVLPVYIFVLTRTDHTGNEYFTREYGERVFSRAAKVAGDTTEITIAGFERIPDDLYDTDSVVTVAWRYRIGWPVTGFVTVVIAPPMDPVGGASFQAELDQNVAPFLVMHTRNFWRELYGDKDTFGTYAPVGSEKDIDDVAHIWLHEMGHNMALFHCEIPNPWLHELTEGLSHPFPDYSTEFCTDNWYRVDPAFLALFARKLEKSRGGR